MIEMNLVIILNMPPKERCSVSHTYLELKFLMMLS